MDNQITADELREALEGNGTAASWMQRYYKADDEAEGHAYDMCQIITDAARLYLATLDAQPTPDTLNQSTCLGNTLNKSDNLKVSDVTLTPLDRWHTNSPTHHDH